MSSLPEHTARWQHRTHATVTGHWHGDRYTLGTVEACDECGDQDGAA